MRFPLELNRRFISDALVFPAVLTGWLSLADRRIQADVLKALACLNRWPIGILSIRAEYELGFTCSGFELAFPYLKFEIEVSKKEVDNDFFLIAMKRRVYILRSGERVGKKVITEVEVDIFS